MDRFGTKSIKIGDIHILVNVCNFVINFIYNTNNTI